MSNIRILESSIPKSWIIYKMSFSRLKKDLKSNFCYSNINNPSNIRIFDNRIFFKKFPSLFWINIIVFLLSFFSRKCEKTITEWKAWSFTAKKFHQPEQYKYNLQFEKQTDIFNLQDNRFLKKVLQKKFTKIKA
jgi:hypothetical protein